MAEQIKKNFWDMTPTFWFPLYLSYKCTRRCPDCFVFNQKNNSQQEMSDKIFTDLLEWVAYVSKSHGLNYTMLLFLGGEPLLRTDRIKKLMDYVQEQYPKTIGSIYTNADLVDSVNWDDLRCLNFYNVNITNISIDELQRRMSIIQSQSNPDHQSVVAVMNTYNMSRICDITNFAVENGYLLHYHKNMCGWSEPSYKQLLLKSMHIVCDCLETSLKNGYKIHTTFLFNTIISWWNKDYSPYTCGKRSAVVYPNGTVGVCLRNHFDKVGTIYDKNPLGIIQNEKYHLDYNRKDLPDECSKCDIKDVCQGGCPNDKLFNFGTTKMKSIMCEIYKEIIPRLKYLDTLKENRRKI